MPPDGGAGSLALEMAATPEKPALANGKGLTTAKAEKPKDDTPKVSYWKLYSGADAVDKVLIFFGIIGAMGGGLGFPLFAIIFGDFINAFGDPTGIDFTATVRVIALNFLYIGIGSLVAMYFEVAFFTLAAQRQTNRLRHRYLAAVLAQEIAFFDVNTTAGGLLQGLNEDSSAVEAALGQKASGFVHHSSTFLAGFIIAFTKGWDLTLVMLGCLPFLALAGAMFFKVASADGDMTARAYAQASTTANQALQNIRTVAAYNGQKGVLTSYSASLDEPLKAGVKTGLFIGLLFGFFQMAMYCSYAVAVVYGVFRITSSNYTGGQVVLVQIATLMASFALGQATPSLEAVSKGQVAGYRMFRIIERQPGIHDVARGPTAGGKAAGGGQAGQNGKHTSNGQEPGGKAGVVARVELPAHNGTGELESVQGGVEFQDVHFCYPARLDVEVFRGFSLVVPAGKTVALVGSSGSGKSTAVQLIERFYDPTTGRVLLDGVDLRALSLSWLRTHVGLVSQEPTLFATSILENIRLGKPDASQAEVEAAAAAANAHNFIRNLPDAYHTQVGEKGVQMSGGQKQRIAIARAILKNPKVLLLDEATSALDTHSERVVQAALDRMVVGRTTLVVAHRLSTIKHAHLIAVVSNGQVIEQGSHEQLLGKQDGAYSLLVQMQQQRAEAEPDVSAADVAQAEGDEEETVEVVDMQEQDVVIAGRRGSVRNSLGTRPGSLEQPAAVRRVSMTGSRTASGTLKEVLVSGGSVQGTKPVLDDGKKDEKKPLSAKEQEALDEAAAKQVSAKRLFTLNRPEWPYIGAGAVASFVAGLQHPAMAFMFTEMITIFFLPDADEMRRKGRFYALMFFVIGLGALISLTIQQLCLGWAGQKLAQRVRVLLLGSLLRQEVGFFDREENNSGRLTSALATDAAYIKGAIGDALGLALQNLGTLVIGYVIALIYNWQMALLVTGAFPLISLAMVLQMQFAVGSSSTNDKLYAKADQFIGEAVSSIRVIHAYNLQPYIASMYENILNETRPILTKQAHLGGVFMGFSFSIIFALYSLIIWFGGWQVSHDQTDFNGMMKGFLAILMAAMGMAQSGATFPDMGKAKGAVGRVFPLIDRQPEIDPDAPGELPAPGKVEGHVEFRHIHFVYPARPTLPIYTDFCLDIPAGKVYALVGESGSGKSTVVSLFERFYDPTNGCILLDGVDIRKFNLTWLRAQVGLVSQEPLLFSATVMDNIRYGKPDASLEEVEAAARVANAHEFVDVLPEKYLTRVGEGGIQLSGGQKQRIAIARAVLKNPKVLLLDEATSALDARSERVVQDALDVVMAGRTCLVIAHRLSTIKNAHAISVLYRGAILEQGSHAELMARPEGAYAKLVAAQEQAHSK